MKRSLLIFFVLSVMQAADVCAQDISENIKYNSDSIKAVSLLNSGINLYNNGDLDSAIYYFDQSLQVAVNNHYPLIEAENYFYEARLMDSLNEWELSLRYYLKSSAIFEVKGLPLRVAEIYKLIGSKYFDFGVYDKSLEYAEREFELYPGDEYINRISVSQIAALSAFLGDDFDKSIEWYGVCYKLSVEEGDTLRIIEALYGITGTKVKQGRELETRQYLEELLLLQSSLNDARGIADVYNSLGLLDFKIGNIDGAINNYTTAAEYYIVSGGGVETAYSNLAICSQNKGNSRQTEEYFEMALDAASGSGNISEKARLEHILAVFNYKKGDLYHAEYYSQSGIESAKEAGNYKLLYKLYLTYSEILESGNDFVKALDNYEKYLNLRDSLAFEQRIKEQEYESIRSRMETYEQQLRLNLADEELKDLALRNLRIENEKRANDLKLLERENELASLEKERLQQDVALEKERYNSAMQEKAIMVLEQQRLLQRRDSILQENEARGLMQENRLLEYEAEQQQHEIEREQQKRRWAIFLALSAGFSLIIILLSLISTRRKNTILTAQKKIIEEKNLTITDSIEYASRIQNAVLPPAGFLKDWGFDSFIMFRPKDIVSGDFYWGAKSGSLLCFAAADCTGHGVPGAFMSMLGTAFLNEIINSRQFTNAADILNQLRNEIITSLKQRGVEGEAQDGMDIALCIYNPDNNVLHFSGANNPLYHISGDSIDRIGPDKMPIGIHVSLDKPFTNYTVRPEKGDLIYLFSDGFADQFGGGEGKKFKYKTFRDMLLEVKDLPLDRQKEIVENRFDSWKGELEQVDDVILMGIRF